MASGDTYVDLDTASHPDGELRGQINSKEITQHLLRMRLTQLIAHHKQFKVTFSFIFL